MTWQVQQGVATTERGEVQVTPAADEAGTQPAASMDALPGDLHRHIFGQACNPLDPRRAVALSSASRGLWAVTREGRQLLRADHEAATVLGRKLDMRSCKELREAKMVFWREDQLSLAPEDQLSSADHATLGTLGSVLPALEELELVVELVPAAETDGVRRLAEKLGAGALPAVTCLRIAWKWVGDAGASALAAALGRGALLRLKRLWLGGTAIGDAGLVALAPALRRLPALETLDLVGNPFGDEGLAALVSPPPPVAGALPPTTGVLAKLKELGLCGTQITDAGCAALAAALDSGALPALDLVLLADEAAEVHIKYTLRQRKQRNTHR